MLRTASENILIRVLSWGSAFTTIFLLSGNVTDPVNAPKLVALGLMGGATLGIVLINKEFYLQKGLSLIFASLSAFVIFSLLSILQSSSPISQGIYGAYGRNNGFLTYFFLSCILFGCCILSIRKLDRLIYAFFFAGIINLAYCLWAILFGDFIGWNNPYGHILGTFGNPNFIGAFLGIFLATYLAWGLSSSASRKFRYSMILVLPISIFEIYKSNAIQGIVVAVAGVAIVFFFYLRSKFNKFVLIPYTSIVVTVGVFGLLGTLQYGPLVKYIYKTSVSLRGQYWLAGLNAGQTHPFKGVGMDSYGDWYRRTRDARALTLPGVDTVSNASHNVVIDMFAFGGWPLLISYLLIMGIGAHALIKANLRTKNFDSTLIVITVAWIGYQLQSIISINQVGLAIWGWIWTGLAISYERSTKKHKSMKESSGLRKNSSTEVTAHSVTLVGALMGGIAGLIISVPPLASDSSWRSAQVHNSLQEIEKSMSVGYFNPQNSTKYLVNILSLERSNLPDLSHKYALEAVKWNPESYDLWKALYHLKSSTEKEKSVALANMKRLDPLNSNLTN